MTQPDEPGHPIGPEVDDSQNPTEAAPAEESGGEAGGAPRPDVAGAQPPRGDEARAGQPAGREMLAQLQAMIDALAVQAAPVMREVAAKAAELAAIAGEKAGPFAHRAAEKTEVVGQRVAARSKEMAAELRRSARDGETTSAGDQPEEPPPG